MNVLESKEYKKCQDYIESFLLMMELSGFHILKKDKHSIRKNALIEIIDRSTTLKGLEIQTRFYFNAYNGKQYSLNKDSAVQTVIAYSEISFYTDYELNIFKIRFKIYNDLLKSLSNKYNEFTSAGNVYVAYCDTFESVDNIIKKIVSIIEEI